MKNGISISLPLMSGWAMHESPGSIVGIHIGAGGRSDRGVTTTSGIMSPVQ